MLELVPHGLSGRRFTLSRDGRVVARLDLTWLREAARVTVGEEAYELRREGLGSGAFELSHHGGVIARAHKPSALRQRFTLEHEGRTHELAKESWWGRAFALRAGGRRVGSVRPHHFFTRRSAVDLPDDLTLPVQAFVAALVTFMWKRDASAAAGAGGGAAGS